MPWILFRVRRSSWSIYALGVAACGWLFARSRKLVRSERKITATQSLYEINDLDALDEVLASDRVILYKHSTRCAVSAFVIDEILRFSEKHPSWKIWILKVIEQRHFSDAVAERLGVRHESPQAFVIRHGRCTWQASHSGITAQGLARYVKRDG